MFYSTERMTTICGC